MNGSADVVDVVAAATFGGTVVLDFGVGLLDVVVVLVVEVVLVVDVVLVVLVDVVVLEGTVVVVVLVVVDVVELGVQWSIVSRKPSR